MKKAKNELLQFLAGLAMLVAGLFIFSQKVMVTSGFFGRGFAFGGFYLNNGLVVVPLIIGIVWMFASGGQFLSKVFTGIGVLIIIVAIIMTTNLSFVHTTLYEWVLILVLIFGGAGLLAKVLLASGRETVSREEETQAQLRQTDRKIREIEEEIERIKRDK